MLTGRGVAQRVFDLQCEFKWTVKTSSPQARKAKLGRLRAEIVARSADIPEALSQDLAKPGGDPYPPEVDSMLTVIDEAVEHGSGHQVVARRAESNKQGPRAQIVPITNAMGGLSRSLMDHRSRP
jgi:hypothetical protein